MLPRFTAPAVIVLGTVLFGLVAGQEMSWDVVNHHYYLPFSWVTGRIHTDYFGAGPQSYQNPLGYLPFYWLVQTGAPQWVVGTALALLHAGCALCAWFIARRLWRDSRHMREWVAIATLLGWLSPTYLQAIGTSSNDPIGALLVLVALALLVCRTHQTSAARATVTGALLGAAVGIKLSNLPWAAACGAVALLQFTQRRESARTLMLWVAGGLAGLVAILAWPAVVLWKAFGNPFFPLFNNLFHSPFGPPGILAANRFVPDTLASWLLRPFEVALPKAYIYTENFAPDIRPAAAVMAALLLLVGCLRRASRSVRAKGHEHRWTARDLDLFTFVACGSITWLAVSGNGRYAIPLAIMVGVFLARCISLALPDRGARLLLIVIASMQAAIFWTSADIHRNAEPWSSARYYDVESSERLRGTPVLHVALGIQSHASIAAVAFDPRGALVNPSGQLSISLEGPRGAPLRRLLATWAGRSRVLIREFPEQERRGYETLYNELVYRLGIAVDWADCEPVRLLKRHDHLGLLSCAARPLPLGTAPGWQAEQPQADRAFTVLEAACPQLYGPAPSVTERVGGAWRRFYANTDTHVLVSRSAGVITMHGRNLGQRRAGAIEDVAAGRVHIDCSPWTWRTPDF